jgi:hypothetical protein
MSVELEERLRRYGETFERAVAASEANPRRVHAPPLHRNWGRWLVAAAVLVGVVVLAVVAFPRGSDNGPRVSSEGRESGLVRYRNDQLGFSLEFPSSWHRAPTPLVPGDGTELVSIGTYDLPAGSTTCPTGPQNALAALPADGAFVWIQQRSDYMFAPARATYPPSDASTRVDNSALCVAGSAYEHWIIPFTEGNRSLRIVVAFGLDASRAVKDAAWKAVNSLEIDPAQPFAIPNDVSPETYAAQADGGTAVLTLPGGQYETVVREDDKICIDLRPSGQPSGPRFCDIPANAAWPTPALAVIVTLDGSNYVIGVTDAETVTQIDINGTAVSLSARQVFPTIRFFAAPVGDTATVTAHTSRGEIPITPAAS